MPTAAKWLSFALLLSASFAAEAQSISAASCSSTDVQNALNSVTSSTQTVNIPAGTCYWTTQVSFTVPSGNTELSILGAGSLTTTGGGDSTVIVDNYANGGGLFTVVTGNASSKLRMAGITFQGGSGSVKYNGMISIGGYSHNLRIDHSHFNANTYTSSNPTPLLQTDNWIEGVLDHNIWDGYVGRNTNAIRVFMPNYGGLPNYYGDGAWATPTGFGTSDFLFIEDSVFNNGFVNDCEYGGKFVLRHNTLNYMTFQSHATGSGDARVRGCRAVEAYGNTFNGSNANPVYSIWYNTNGAGMIWGNSAPAGYKLFASNYVDRKDNGTYSQATPPNGWGYCGTAFDGVGSNWDGNTNASTGYPCLDQIGRGQGDMLSGYFPTAQNNTTPGVYTGTWPHQALDPVYEWSDTWVCSGCGGTFWGLVTPTIVTANQDYFLGFGNSSCNAGAGSCTGGVGVGTLAQRPTTCTTGPVTDSYGKHPGVGWWDVVNNALYVCTGGSAGQTGAYWSASPYYQPYTYPHPLAQGSGGGMPNAPTSLQAIVN